jgi:HlyD family secretion protein
MFVREGNLFAPTQGCTNVKKWLLFLLLTVAVACGLYFWWGLTGVQPLQEKTLTFGEVRRATIRDIVSATGLVEPNEIVIVSSETPGTILHISKRVGDPVTSGDELARLDDRRIVLKIEEANTGIKMAEAALLQAEAALAQSDANKDAAERYWKTQQELQKAGGPGFRAEREQAEAQLKTALAGIKVAQAGIEVVRAKKQAAQTARKEAQLAQELTRLTVPGLVPLSGMKKREFLIIDRKVNEGQLVGPQTGPMFTLAGGLDLVEVHAQVVEGDINRIHTKLSASFKIKDYNDDDTEFEGFVKEIRPQAGNIKGASYYDAVIEVKNRRDPITKEWQLRPGMTASIDIVRVEHKNAWRVPSAALIFKMEEAYQNEAAKARLAEWKKRPDARDWYPLWTWDETARQAQPVFVRVSGKKNGEPGLKDSEGNEILEWEPGKEPTGPLRVIIDAPKSRPPGFFDQPANVKI